MLLNVGIGTTNLGYPLDVNGQIKTNSDFLLAKGSPRLIMKHTSGTPAAGVIDFQGSGGVVNWEIGTRFVGDGGFEINNGDSTNNRFYITTAGNVGIGTTGPSAQLELSLDSAKKPSTNTWTIASDARIKEDIRPFTDGLSVVQGIHPVWYKYNGKAGFRKDGADHIGVLAQDVQPVAPYTIEEYQTKLNPADATETALLEFNSHALTFVLINAVNEQQKQIEQLQARLVALERRK